MIDGRTRVRTGVFILGATHRAVRIPFQARDLWTIFTLALRSAIVPVAVTAQPNRPGAITDDDPNIGAALLFVELDKICKNLTFFNFI